jgi:hypothetical protein
MGGEIWCRAQKTEIIFSWLYPHPNSPRAFAHAWPVSHRPRPDWRAIGDAKTHIMPLVSFFESPSSPSLMRFVRVAPRAVSRLMAGPLGFPAERP